MQTQDNFANSVKSYSPAMASGGNANAEIVEELRAVRSELADLKTLQAENNVDTKQYTQQFDNVTAGGNAILTMVA